jgi:hypothetical protein
LGGERVFRMISFWLQKRHYQNFRQFAVWTVLIFTATAEGQVSPSEHVNRRPASYIPDDDVIVKPVDNELSFYQQYVASDNSEEVIQSRNQIKVWNDNQQFADDWGMDSTLTGSPFFVPTPDQKFQYFKDRYMRYLRRRGEDPLKNMPKNWYQDYRASNEVDTIDEMESRFKSNNKTASSTKGVASAFSQQEISLWKKTRFIFQPRVEQGLVVVGIRGPIAYARAWVGINGQAEFNLQKSFDSIGFRLMFNYYAHTGRYFTSVDQRIMENVYLRVTSQKNPETLVKDDTAMLLYAKQF